MTIQPAFESEMPGIEVYCERFPASFSEPAEAVIVEIDLHEYFVETFEVEDMVATAGPSVTWHSYAVAA